MNKRQELFQPTVEGEARVLMLIDGFTTKKKSLEGRTKLAKLDFFLRYPHFMERAISIRHPDVRMEVSDSERQNIEGGMIRYRYGPWDPAYYAILGRLLGKKLIEVVPNNRGLSYRTTEKGAGLAKTLAGQDSWMETEERIKLLKKHFDLSGNKLKNFIYEHFEEVTKAGWGEKL